jgi:hypothetical protein
MSYEEKMISIALQCPIDSESQKSLVSQTDYDTLLKYCLFCFSGISGDSCEIVNWNYTILADLSYEEALNYTNNANYPGKYECDSWSYEGNGIVSEVCY